MTMTIKMSGTEKQISWANDILENYFWTCRRNAELCSERGLTKEIPLWHLIEWKMNKSLEAMAAKNGGVIPASKIIEGRDAINALDDYQKHYTVMQNTRKQVIETENGFEVVDA